MTKPRECPGCSTMTTRSDCDGNGVATCPGCGGIFTTRRLYLGDSYAYTLPRWATNDVPPERLQYFDLDVLGSDGLQRRHGFMDRETRLIVQTG